MKQLPRHAAELLAEFPAAEQRFQLLAAKLPMLEATSESAFAAHQAAAKVAKDLEGDLARAQNQETAARDLNAEAALANQLSAAAATRDNAYLENKRRVIISHGSKVAFERTILLVEGELTANNAKLVGAGTKLPKGADPVALVAEQRAKLAALDEEVKAIRKAPPPVDDVIARAVAEIDEAARRGRLQIGGGGSLVLPEVVTDARPIVGTAGVKVTDSFALLAALHRDELVEQAKAAARERYRDIPPSEQLSPLQKKEKLAAIDRQYFETELLEVAAVVAAWSAASNDIGLRPDTNPLAVLDVQSWTPRPRREEPLLVWDVPPVKPRPQPKEWVGEREAVEAARR